MRSTQKITVLFLLLFISLSHAQNKKTISPELKIKKLPFGLVEYIPAYRPTVGLALSGGGARALSQIGVLKALVEAGIETDVIVGTSMGSIVGGLYASGFTIDELDSIAVHTGWDDLTALNNETARSELFVDQKITEDRALFTLRLDGLKPVLPTSFNNGQRLSNYLYLLTAMAPVHPNGSFDNLWAKYRAVCTDLISGELVVIDEGSISRAMRASSSVTFFLEPVEWEDWLLVDGGLVSNIPVDITIQNGANLVIAVNTTSPLHSEEEIDLPWYIADQVVSIPIKKLNERELFKADFIIEPKLDNNTSTDFSRIDTLITIGYNTALPVVKVIKSSIDSIRSFWMKKDEFFVKNIVKHNTGIEELNILLSDYASGYSVASSELLRDVTNLYESGMYKNIKIELAEYEDSTRLNFIYQLNPLINSVHTIGITILDEPVINSLLSNLIHNPYKNRTIAKAISRILRQYRLKGFILANFVRLDFDESTGILMLYFDEGLISRIRVEGSYTGEELIKREVPIKEGDYLSFQKVREGLDNLRSTRFFRDVEMRVVEEDEKNILVIYVDEKVSSVLRVGFLVDETYNAQFSLDIRDENIFGSGAEVGLFLFGGASNRAYIFELKNHRILNSYFTYNISAFYKFNDINLYTDSPTETNKRFSKVKSGEYRQIFYGASLSLGTQVEKFGNLIFTGRYQLDEVKNVQGNEILPYKTKIVTLGISSTVDNMDSYPYPSKGLYFSGLYETAQSFLGGDEGYTKIEMDIRNFFRLGKRSTVVPRLKIGFGDKTLPLSEQFLLGGMNSFFGMRENEFRGRQIFLASLMYRIKLPFQIFFDTYLKLRYDLGTTWEQQEQIRFKDLRHGIGGVLSFDTPIGPADFSIGRSFLLKKNLPENPISWGDLLFYFSIGYEVKI